jgi:hypothetical protein
MKKPQASLTPWETAGLRTLEDYRFSPKTNIAEGRISNHDAACYLLQRCIKMSCSRLTHLLRIWRAQSLVRANANAHKHWLPPVMPALSVQVRRVQRAMKLQFTYLFNTSNESGYGFVGRGFDSTHNVVRYYNHYGSLPRDVERSTYWYRIGKGVYTCTVLGLRRAAAISKEMKQRVT